MPLLDIGLDQLLAIWITDALRIIFAGFPFILYYVRRYMFGHQHRGGFFCDDKSLMLPYKGQTISSKEVLVHTLIVPIVIIGAVELVRERSKRCLPKAYRTSINFVIGYLVSVSLMWLPKFFDGGIGLRPHFFDLCRPVLADGSTCQDAKNYGRYIEDYTCTRPDFPQRIYRTFPSGHSTVSSYAVIFLMAYIQARVKNGSKFKDFKLAVQYLLLLYGVFCPVSRIFDNQHHPADVIFGALLGTAASVLVIIFVAGKFAESTGKCDAKEDCCKAKE